MIVYSLLGLIAVLLLLLVMLVVLLYKSLTRPNPINQELILQNRELLNRLQSPDARTFLALQTSSVTLGTESDYVSRDDEAEAAFLASQAGGNGETIYIDPDEVNDYNLADFR